MNPIRPSPFPTLLRRVELRLAVVYYGGVSLAVYSFGHTCELRNLYLASQAFDKAYSGKLAVSDAELRSNRDTLKGSSAVYFDLLNDIRTTSKIHLTVNLDLVSGTSAGGINSIILGKSIALGKDLESLNHLWLENADINDLEYTTSTLLLRKSSFSGWALGGLTWAVEKGVAAKDLVTSPFRKSTSLTVLPTNQYNYATTALQSGLPLFDGEKFHQTLFDGLKGMKDAAGEVSKTNKCSIFTTFTDLSSIQNAVSGEPQHLFVLRFDQGDGFSDLEDDAALAFAARSTSAFPLAFPGISLNAGAKLGKYPPNAKPFLDDQLRNWTLEMQAGVRDAFNGHECADGGIMLNKPFQPILRELKGRRRTKGNNVQRRLLYVEPNPEPKAASVSPGGQSPATTVPVQGPAAKRAPLFSSEEVLEFGGLAKLFNGRFEELCAEKGKKSGKPTYDWASHVLQVASAASSQPIAEDLIAVKEFGDQLLRGHQFVLRSVARCKEDVEAKFSDKTLWEEDADSKRLIPLMWEGTSNLLASSFTRLDLMWCPQKFAAPDVQMTYLDARFNDFKLALTHALAARSWLFYPEGTMHYEKLALAIDSIFSRRGGLDDAIESKLQDTIDYNIFLLRDLLMTVNQSIENPHWLNSGGDVLSSDYEGILALLSSSCQEAIGRLDDIVAEPMPEILELLKFRLESVKEENLLPLRTWWKEKSDKVFAEMLGDIDKHLSDFTREHPDLDDGRVRRLIFRPMFTFAYFECMTFPRTSLMSFGDNTTTKLVRLSPDSTLPSSSKEGNDKDTALFRGARERIRAESSVSISKVFLRSSDLMSFGGFLHRSYREFDIMWGRLDSSEQLCRLLVDVVNDEICREESDVKLMRRELELGAETSQRQNVPNINLAGYCLNASLSVLEDLNTVALDKDNVKFFQAMKKALQSRL